MLESQGLLTQEENRYMTTAKGLQFVNAFIQLQSALGGSGFEISSPSRLTRIRLEPKKPPVAFYV